MNAQFDTRGERQLLVHPFRENSNDFRAGRREPANEQNDLELKPVAVFLNNR